MSNIGNAVQTPAAVETVAKQINAQFKNIEARAMDNVLVIAQYKPGTWLETGETRLEGSAIASALVIAAALAGK